MERVRGREYLQVMLWISLRKTAMRKNRDTRIKKEDYTAKRRASKILRDFGV
jgi:hypothetical protein